MASNSTGPKRRTVRMAALAGGTVLVLLTALFAVFQFTERDRGNASETSVPRELTSKEEELLKGAEELLLQECMADHGFEYTIAREEPPTPPQEFRYVIDDPDWAAEHGYGSAIQRDVAELRENDPNQQYFESLPEERKAAALRAANGPRPVGLTATTPDGMELSRSDQGCRSQAERELYADLPAWFRAQTTVDALPEIRRQRVTGDPRYQETTRLWADCMDTAGYDYDTPTDLRRTLSSAKDPFSEREETRLAQAEADCAVESGLSETAMELDEYYADELQRQYRSAVTTKRRLQLEALPRASAITEEAAGGQ